MPKKKKRHPRFVPRKDWPFQYALAVLLGILTALAIVFWKPSILIVSSIAILLGYLLKKEWEK
jgi:hypothetical protein